MYLPVFPSPTLSICYSWCGMVLQSKTKWRPKPKLRRGPLADQRARCDPPPTRQGGKRKRDVAYAPKEHTSPSHKKLTREVQENELSILNLMQLPDGDLVSKLVDIGILCKPQCLNCLSSDVTLQFSRKQLVWRCCGCEDRTSILLGSIFVVPGVKFTRLSLQQLLVMLLGFLSNRKWTDVAQDAGVHDNSVIRYHQHFRKALPQPYPFS